MSKRRSSRMWLLVLLALAACESNPASREPNDPPAPIDACQNSPGELPRPPAGSLPCELIPPGLELAGSE